jgi:hypothetical protein
VPLAGWGQARRVSVRGVVVRAATVAELAGPLGLGPEASRDLTAAVAAGRAWCLRCDDGWLVAAPLFATWTGRELLDVLDARAATDAAARELLDAAVALAAARGFTAVRWFAGDERVAAALDAAGADRRAKVRYEVPC